MATITLLERKKKRLEQQKNKIKKQESVIKLLERKQKLQRLIELGGIVVKAGIDNLENDVLLGAFLEVKDSLEKNPNIKEKWKKIGNN